MLESGRKKRDDSLKRLQRLVKILQIIENRKPGRRELAEELGRHERQIYRDVNDLQAAGFPIIYDRAASAYRFQEGFSLRKVSVSPDELHALILAKELGAKTGGTLAKGIDRVFQKVLQESSRAYPSNESPVKMQLEPGVDFAKVETQYDALAGAIKDGHRAMIEHGGLDGKYLKREIDPYRLFYSDGFWYVLAWCHVRDDVRTFALDRIRKVTVLGKHVLTNAGFDFDEYMAKCWRNYYLEDPQEVRLLFLPAAAKDIRRKQWHPTQKIKERKDGSLELSVVVSGQDEIMRWVLSWGREAKALGPSKFKGKIQKEIAAMAGSYRHRK